MLRTLAHSLKIVCAAVGFVLALHAADPAPPPASPIGLTRDQVIKRYGDPKSQIVAGNRLVMFYTNEKLTLTDGKVTFVDPISSEPVRRPVPVPTEPPAAATGAPGATATSAEPGTATPPAEATNAAAPAAPTIVTPQAPVAVTPTPTPPTPLEPKFEIKSVRQPTAGYSRPSSKQDTQPAPSIASSAPKQSTPTVAISTPPVAEKKSPPSPSMPPSATPPVTSPLPTAPMTTAMIPSARRSVATTEATETPTPVEPPEVKPEDPETAEKAAKTKKINRVKARRRIAEAGEEDVPDIAEAFITTRTLIIIFLIGGGGVAYILWMIRQRQLLLAVTAVSHSPFGGASPSTGGGGATFNAELLSKLEWKRFEELVAEYYSKTGVVAVRTKSGPASPVHIKISWKGEPRPFACVQCIAHPTGLIDAKPLQDLVTVLAAEDIRRGYVVTSGKFNVTARDYAEEKHLTLLPGDIFLEKLNALPDTARTEIMQMVTSGDFMTPSCPKCEGKMVKSTEDPTMWTCPNHPDQLIPVWK